MMPDARLMTFSDLRKCERESTLYLETKQTLRPAFFYGIIDRIRLGIDGDGRYAAHLLTPAKIVKHWEMRLYNKTWRLWDTKPTRAQRMDEKWDAWEVKVNGDEME